MRMESTGTRLPRSAGVLLHVTSLPGPFGIGDLGPAAFRWIDQLEAARQSWWQFLPLGPTGYADSPYQCFSAFAGNVNLISLERLVELGLLREGELPRSDFSLCEVDFGRVRLVKDQMTLLAFERFKASGNTPLQAAFDRFQQQTAAWLMPFAAFIALKEQFGGSAWWDWPATYRYFRPDTTTATAREFSVSFELCLFRQFLFLEQWRAVRQHAHQRGIRLIGDMPIFVAADSADVWASPDLFQLDHQRRPLFVAGVPPDYFSKTGQLWGNPLYDWEKHRATDFAWWKARLRSTLELVDMVRLDHFRGFEAYWAVPAGSSTAEPGAWIKAPGAELFENLERSLGDLPLIAEDLGVITPEVDSLRTAFHLPGMRVLQFAFGGAVEDRFLPHNFERRTVVYTGTHDNETSLGWFHSMEQQERDFFDRYAPLASRDPAWALIRLAWASVANLAIAPLQDILRLGNEARMNLPGTSAGNWKWRVDERLLRPELFGELAELTTTYQREPKSADKP